MNNSSLANRRDCCRTYIWSELAGRLVEERSVLQGKAGAGAGLAQDVGDVRFDRALLQPEACGDLGVGATARDLGEHIALARAEPAEQVLRGAADRADAQRVHQ